MTLLCHVIRACTEALALGSFIGAIAMLTYDPPATAVDVRAAIEEMLR